jgi:hypothetical protein
VAVGIEADQKVFQFYGVGVLPARRCGTSLDHGVLLVIYMYINIHVYVYVFWVLDGGRPRALLIRLRSLSLSLSVSLSRSLARSFAPGQTTGAIHTLFWMFAHEHANDIYV